MVIATSALYLAVDVYILNRGVVVQTSGLVSYTSVVKYAPAADVLPNRHETGSCFASSVAAPYRPDAWRCMVGNAISDPCFRIAESQDLLCDPDPVDTLASSSFTLGLTGHLPNPDLSKVAAPADWGGS